MPRYDYCRRHQKELEDKSIQYQEDLINNERTKQNKRKQENKQDKER
jgi:glutaredoxin